MVFVVASVGGYGQGPGMECVTLACKPGDIGSGSKIAKRKFGRGVDHRAPTRAAGPVEGAEGPEADADAREGWSPGPRTRHVSRKSST